MPGRVGDAADGRIFHDIADRRLDVGIRVDYLIVDREIVQLVVLSMRQGDILRGPFACANLTLEIVAKTFLPS